MARRSTCRGSPSYGVFSGVGYRRVAKAPESSPPVDAARAPPIAPLSVPGDCRYEIRHGPRFLALVQQRRHLPEAARAAFFDRVEHKRLAPRGRGDVVAD